MLQFAATSASWWNVLCLLNDLCVLGPVPVALMAAGPRDFTIDIEDKCPLLEAQVHFLLEECLTLLLFLGLVV